VSCVGDFVENEQESFSTTFFYIFLWRVGWDFCDAGLWNGVGNLVGVWVWELGVGVWE